LIATAHRACLQIIDMSEAARVLKQMVDMMNSGDEPGAGSQWHTEAVAALREPFTASDLQAVIDRNNLATIVAMLIGFSPKSCGHPHVCNCTSEYARLMLTGMPWISNYDEFMGGLGRGKRILEDAKRLDWLATQPSIMQDLLKRWGIFTGKDSDYFAQFDVRQLIDGERFK
jgi:hypothetical protein